MTEEILQEIIKDIKHAVWLLDGNPEDENLIRTLTATLEKVEALAATPKDVVVNKEYYLKKCLAVLDEANSDEKIGVVDFIWLCNEVEEDAKWRKDEYKKLTMVKNISDCYSDKKIQQHDNN